MSDDTLNRYFLRPQAAPAGHAVDVLIDGREVFPAILDAIGAAETEILFEIYTWLDDAVGRLFVDALIERAHHGVRVVALVDGFGSLALPDGVRARLIASGVSFAVFHPVPPWKPRWAWAARDHRKLVVIDRAVAFTGGLNFTEEYAPLEAGGRNWHDVHARVRGPAVEVLREHFFASWRHATGDNISHRHRPREERAGAGARVQVLAISRFRGRRRIRQHYHFTVRQARSTVRIMVAYFIPDRGWRRVLRNAVRRGVDVSIMLPHASDVPAVQWAARATYGRLLRAGVKVYEWLPSMLHAKVLAVDGVVSSIGTYNLDRRSFKHNWELSLLIGDRATATVLEQRFDADLSQCIAIEQSTWSRRGFLVRVVERFFYLFRRWL